MGGGGEDPAFTPQGILATAARTGRYSAEEIAALDFAEPPPEPRVLSARWHEILAEADRVVATLPAAEIGLGVLMEDGSLYRADAANLGSDLAQGKLRFHAGSIRGAFPRVR